MISVSSQEDTSWIAALGKGTKQEEAIVDGWQKAMLKYIQQEMDSMLFYNNKNTIKTFVQNNWKNYFLGNPAKPTIIRSGTKEVLINFHFA